MSHCKGVSVFHDQPRLVVLPEFVLAAAAADKVDMPGREFLGLLVLCRLDGHRNGHRTHLLRELVVHGDDLFGRVGGARAGAEAETGARARGGDPRGRAHVRPRVGEGASRSRARVKEAGGT